MNETLGKATEHYRNAWGWGRTSGGQSWRTLAAAELQEMIEMLARDTEKERVYREQAYESERRGLETATRDRLEVAERFRRRRLAGLRELFVATVAAARLAMDTALLSDDESSTGLDASDLVWVARVLTGGK